MVLFPEGSLYLFIFEGEEDACGGSFPCFSMAVKTHSSNENFRKSWNNEKANKVQEERESERILTLNFI